MKLLILFLIFMNVVWGNTIEIISDSDIAHGDPANIVLRIDGKLTEAELQEALKKSNNKLGPFYIHNTGFIKEEDGQTVIGLNTFYDNPKFLGGAKLELSNPIVFTLNNPNKLQRAELKPEPQFQYYIRKFDLPNDLSFLFYALAFVFIAIGLIVLKRYLDYQKEKREEKEYYQNWIRAFKACYKREDYERIYKERKKWIPLIGTDAKKFIKTLNKHQYKKEWSQEDMAQVTNEFNKLKDRLIENGI